MIKVFLCADRSNILVKETFEVRVFLTNIPSEQEILGLHHVLIFDPKRLQIVDFKLVEDSLLNPLIGEPLVAIDNPQGIFDFNLARSSTTLNSSKGYIYSLTFMAMDYGITPIIQDIVDFRDADGVHIPSINNSLRFKIYNYPPYCRNFK